MSKFRYYITNTFDGVVRGTNDEHKAHECAACEEYFVVDSEAGEWIGSDGGEPVVDIDSED